MRVLSPYTHIVVFLALAAFFVIGCSTSPSPEQLQADSLFTRAGQSFSSLRYRQSHDSFLAALALDRTLGRWGRVADELHGLGEIHAAQANYDSALNYLQQSIEQYRALARRDSVHALTLRLAEIHRWLGEERKAYALYSEALRLAGVFGELEHAQEIKWAMIPVCRALDFDDEESRLLNEVLTRAASAGDAGAQARCAYESGLSVVARGDHGAAETQFLRALTLAEQVHDSLLSIRVLQQLAMSYASTGRRAESFQMYTDALTRSDVTRGAQSLREEMLTRVGNAYLRAANPMEALRFYRAALQSAIQSQNKITEGYLFIQIGHCESMIPGKREEGLVSYRSALDLFNGLSYRQGSAYALTSIGIATQKAGRLTDAVAALKAAVEEREAGFDRREAGNLLDDCEAAFADAGGAGPYTALIEQLLLSGNAEDAFTYLQRKHGREWTDIFGELELTARDTAVTVALAKFRHEKALAIGAERQLERLLMSGRAPGELLEDVRKNLKGAIATMQLAGDVVTRMNNAFAPATGVQTISARDAQQRLPQNTMLIEHFPGTRSLYSVVLAQGRVSALIAAVERDRVVALTGEFTRLLREREALVDSPVVQTRPLDRRIQELATSLYALFIRPVEPLTSGITKLIVVRSEEFQDLPLHALRSSVTKPGTYVAERFDVSYLPSALALSSADPAAKRIDEVVAFGHPGSTSWDVEYELRDIRSFYKDVKLMFEDQATLQNLERQRGDILHLALEVRPGLIHAGNASVLLSDGQSAETARRVTVGRLPGIAPFPAVIFSDLGRGGTGALVPALLLMNGTPTVEMNSFIPSRKTKKFFGEMFYTSLLAGNSPAAALRQAQREMIKNPLYSAPHLWAPFTVWGK